MTNDVRMYVHTGPYSLISRESKVNHTKPEVTGDEVITVCTRTGDRKTSGPDGNSNVAVKVAIRHIPDMFANVYH